jgi:hypothetical protein
LWVTIIEVLKFAVNLIQTEKCNCSLIKITLTLAFVVAAFISDAQHIQYRDKKKPAANKTAEPTQDKTVPLPDNTIKIIPADTAAKPVAKIPEKKIVKDTVKKAVAGIKDTSFQLTKTKSAFTMNPRPKKPYVEEQNMCDLMSRPEVAPTLPVVINNVSPEMVKMLKERYQGRLYSITGLNMFDQRLKYKLKICDRNMGKFRSEYLDKDGNVVTDPDFDYE